MNYKQFCEENMNNLDDYDKFIDLLNEEDKLDSILCHAINETIDNLNITIQMESTAGSTVCSLFLRNVYEHNNNNNIDCSKKDKILIQTRAYCANIGDSRCVMVTAIPCSTDQHPKHSISEFFKRRNFSNDSLNDSCHSIHSDQSTFAKVFVDEFEQSNNSSPSHSPTIDKIKIRSSSLDADTLDELSIHKVDETINLDKFYEISEKTDNSIKSEISTIKSNSNNTNFSTPINSLKHRTFSHSESIPIPWQDTLGAPLYVIVHLIQASEDHSVKCSRERRRISCQVLLILNIIIVKFEYSCI